jgi:hypothetical protein
VIAALPGQRPQRQRRITLTLACDAGVAILFYDLLKAVNRGLSLVAALFKLMLILQTSREVGSPMPAL